MLFLGYYSQFDTMILPNAKVKVAKSSRRKIWEYVKRVETDHPEAIFVPDPVTMRSQCMEIYMQPTKDELLTGKYSESFTILSCQDWCVSLFRCIYIQWVECRAGYAKEWLVDGIGYVCP